MVPVVVVSLDVHFRGFLLYFCSALCLGTLNRHDSSGFESLGGKQKTYKCACKVPGLC